MKPIDKAVALVVVAVAIAYGGTKPVQNAGADEGIALVGVTASYDTTNNVSSVAVAWTNGTVTTATPVSVRNAASEPWRELVKIGAAIETGATNVLSFTVADDVTTNRFWWVGIDTPAIVIETTAITITNFVASSRSVHIAWMCDDPKAVAFTIQRRRMGTATIETVATTTENSYTYNGFTVGESWEWRVTSTYAEDGQ